MDLDAIMQAYNRGGGTYSRYRRQSDASLRFDAQKRDHTFRPPERVILYGVAFENEDFLGLVYDFMQEEPPPLGDLESIVVKSDFNGQLSSRGPASLAIQNFFENGGVVAYPPVQRRNF